MERKSRNRVEHVWEIITLATSGHGQRPVAHSSQSYYLSHVFDTIPRLSFHSQLPYRNMPTLTIKWVKSNPGFEPFPWRTIQHLVILTFLEKFYRDSNHAVVEMQYKLDAGTIERKAGFQNRKKSYKRTPTQGSYIKPDPCTTVTRWS